MPSQRNRKTCGAVLKKALGGERDDEARPGQVSILRIHPKDGISDPQQRYFWKEEVSGGHECQSSW